ncbi:diguanylate cyclase [Phormidium sp. LEGE 05292]|uniref:sensor domain-containing diguanylate cyclase n=1 Tax=[Phormidium] sp. LEGE 05292 TaxID=767427 RepID=UPI00187FE9EF|nr:diguanylate cyclase [Phormidium sp. LEGE 05292]MBE9227748.1 diguanylate cyclase [Phormidium sp. LEGE 05292]
MEANQNDQPKELQLLEKIALKSGDLNEKLSVGKTLVGKRRVKPKLQTAKSQLEMQLAYTILELRQAYQEVQIKIIENERIQKLLQEQAELLNLVDDAILIRDLNNIISFWNQSAEKMFGFAKHEVIAKPYYTLLRTQFPKPLPEIQSEFFQKGCWEGELIHTKSDGTQIAVYSRWILRKNAKNIPQEIIEINKDVTVVKGTEEALSAVGLRLATEETLQKTNEKLIRWVKELEARNQEIVLLGEMSNILQACLTTEEAYQIVAQLIEPLFPDMSGAVFMMSNSKQLVSAVASWGDASATTEMVFTPNECWGLRRGRSHLIESSHSAIKCKHSHHDSTFGESLCVPMMAQGEALGVLYLTASKGLLTKAKQQLAITVAEQIALALGNLKLHEALQQQSIRDPLTGLFNRRYLEESLEREVSRAERKEQNLGIIMLDVDHFKRFNDTFGHDAGDTLLRELGLFLKKNIRGSDIACRFGGEEFLIILPEASVEVTVQRAELIREGIKHLNLHNRNQQLGTITVSLGVAIFPQHGMTGEIVIQAADTALYQAKAQGRDRVIVALC